MRLINADELKKKVYRIDDSLSLSSRDVINEEDIDDAPTVFELPDNLTNGDMIKAIFPDVITTEMMATVHATTKVICCSEKHCKGAVSYDFWKEWWNAPYEFLDNSKIGY